VTLLALLAIPSFIAFCFLAIIHTLQTTSLRLAQSASFPSEAVLQEFFPAAPALRAAPAGRTRIRTYECLVQNASRPMRTAFSRESSLPTLLRVPIPASFFREYRRWPDSSLRIANIDSRLKPFAARTTFPQRRTRLSALARRPRSLGTALMSYS
jgi:hypothetical protein